MMEQFGVALVGVIVGSGVPWAARTALHALRGGQAAEQSEIARTAAQLADALDLVDVLRKALDKHMIRWTSAIGACELLIALVGMIEAPTPSMVSMRNRALRLLEDARAHLTGINNDGGTE